MKKLWVVPVFIMFSGVCINAFAKQTQIKSCTDGRIEFKLYKNGRERLSATATALYASSVTFECDDVRNQYGGHLECTRRSFFPGIIAQKADVERDSVLLFDYTVPAPKNYHYLVCD